jgi:intein/homing endonuclease
MLKTSKESFWVVSAPSDWRSMLLLGLSEHDCHIYPILKHTSSKRWLRDENLFPSFDEILPWTPND